MHTVSIGYMLLGMCMKSYILAGISVLFMSSFLGAADDDKERSLEELMEARRLAFGESPVACMKTDNENLDEFLSAMGRIGDYIDDNSKNKMGIKDETLSKAAKTVDEKTRELLVIVSAIHGTRTKDGLESLGKLLKSYEERLGETEEKLKKAEFDVDGKKKANEVLGEAIKHIKDIIGHVTKATKHKIAMIEKPVKKKDKKDAEKDKAKLGTEASQTNANGTQLTAQEQGYRKLTPAQRRALAQRHAREALYDILLKEDLDYTQAPPEESQPNKKSEPANSPQQPAE